jgi:(p)ppGpp synthase/HD superfamily hydrolase
MNKKIDIVAEARDLAQRAHEGQYRKFTPQGLEAKPYFSHPEEVALAVAACGWATPAAVAAAYLHDVLEDTEVSQAEVLAACGLDVLALVVELTNTSALNPETASLPRAQRKAIDRRRLATVSDTAKRIKLIDRTCNLREMAGASKKFKQLYAAESVELVEVLKGSDAVLEVRLAEAIFDLSRSVEAQP